MEYKVFIFSNKIINGYTSFDMKKFNQICAYNLIDISGFVIDNFYRERDFITFDDNLLIFCDNKDLDDLILYNLPKISGEKELINDQIVVYKKNDKKYVFVPLEVQLDLLNDVFKEDKTYEVLRYRIFGLGRDRIINSLDILKNEIEGFKYKIDYKDLLCDIYLTYSSLKEGLLDDNKAKILNTFNQYIYSENSLSLEQIIYNYLSESGQTIAINENITKGELLASLLSEEKNFINVIKNYIIRENIEIDDQQFIDRSMKFLNSSQSDVAILTAGKEIDGGLEFKFSLVTKDEVHVYNSTFKADKTSCVNMAKNSILFHLAKKLRKNDFAF